MKKLIVIMITLFCQFLFAITYYVSPAGNDDNNGLTLETSFETIERATYAVAPGDTVLIRNGIYTKVYPESLIAYLTISGTEGNPITYKNYPGETPILQMNGTNWGAITINGCDYITIEGLTIIGNNDNITLEYAQSQQNIIGNPATAGNGIAINAQYQNEINKPHHVIIKNCTVSKCGGGGIYSYNADYITLENNIVSECGWYTPYGNSGISMYQNWSSDDFTGIKNFIIGNTCYRNENFIPWFVTNSILDGNGIIIDDNRNTQNGSTLGVYNGTTYVANNLVFDNGGRGIHCYESDNVIIANNTCYKNCQSPFVQEGEFTAYDSSNITYVNNISSPDVGISPIKKDDNTTSNIVAFNNLFTSNASIANPQGINTIVGNADFINASVDFSVADFHTQQSSLAINAGSTFNAPLLDKDGFERLTNGFIDIGCYEYQSSLSNITLNIPKVNVFPNPVSTILNLENLEINSVIQITNNLGQVVYSDINTTNSINFTNFQTGIYFLKLNNSIFKIVKK